MYLPTIQTIVINTQVYMNTSHNAIAAAADINPFELQIIMSEICSLTYVTVIASA